MSTQYVQVILKLFSPEECKLLVAKLEDSPLLEAERNGAEYYRSVFFNKSLAETISKRMFHLVPQYANKRPTEVSDRFRFSKYNPGGAFSLHQDGMYQDPRNGRRSAYTLSIFLNDDFTGGETAFYDGNSLSSAVETFSVPPEVGKAILFPREVYHCGNEVKTGFKYLLRTDIMVDL